MHGFCSSPLRVPVPVEGSIWSVPPRCASVEVVLHPARAGAWVTTRNSRINHPARPPKRGVAGSRFEYGEENQRGRRECKPAAPLVTRLLSVRLEASPWTLALSRERQPSSSASGPVSLFGSVQTARVGKSNKALHQIFIFASAPCCLTLHFTSEKGLPSADEKGLLGCRFWACVCHRGIYYWVYNLVGVVSHCESSLIPLAWSSVHAASRGTTVPRTSGSPGGRRTRRSYCGFG